MIRRLLVPFLGTAAALIGQPVLAQTFQTYHCRDGSEFVAALYQDSRTLYVQLDGKPLSLRHRPSLSGSRYAKGDVSLHITNKATILKRGRRSIECSAS
jgi:membrane-bound inhibitor of C-type lysozyme